MWRKPNFVVKPHNISLTWSIFLKNLFLERMVINKHKKNIYISLNLFNQIKPIGSSNDIYKLSLFKRYNSDTDTATIDILFFVFYSYFLIGKNTKNRYFFFFLNKVVCDLRKALNKLQRWAKKTFFSWQLKIKDYYTKLNKKIAYPQPTTCPRGFPSFYN